MKKKLIHKLAVKDFRKYPIWKYTHNDATGETEVSPVTVYPAKVLIGCLIGTELQLNNGLYVFGFISNLDQSNAVSSAVFKSLTVYNGKERFHLARYFDFNIKTHGPKGLAKFLNLKVSDIFPIRYDISAISKGKPAILKGSFVMEPVKRLSRSAIMSLAVSRK